MAYGVYNYLPRSMASDQVLSDKSFAITSITNYDEYQWGLVSIVYKFVGKKSRDTTAHTGTCIISEDQKLANDLHRPTTRTLKKRKYIPLFDIIFEALILQACNYKQMHLQIFTAAWVVALKEKKYTTISSELQKILYESSRKTNETWVTQASELFYNRSMKPWLHDNSIEVYTLSILPEPK